MRMRFWDYVNGSPAKITLDKPGDELHHIRRHQTEEGFDGQARTWRHTGDGVDNELSNWGRDCDGGTSFTGTYHANYEDLAAGNWDEDHHGIIYPRWNRIEESRRDQFAEAAGY